MESEKRAHLEQRARLADLLERVAHGELSPEAALKTIDSWQDIPWKEKEINNAWHSLTHYVIDTDIRTRDQSYSESVKSGLLHHAAKLRRD